MAFELADTASLAQWLSWQETLHTQEIDLGLERVAQVAVRLDLIPQSDTLSGSLKNCSRVVTLAGTNGKGSCAATLEALALSEGSSVGVYSSPHFHRYNERIRLNGYDACDADIVAAFKAIDRARGDISLSYFEFGTLAALWLFSRAQVDWVILEVGLGGRLDAVNIVDADLAVVTSIGLDHQDWLGTDLHQIGREKAGVMRSNKPAINLEPNRQSGVLEVATELSAQLQSIGRDFEIQRSKTDFSVVHGRDKDLFGLLPLPSLPLPSVVAALLAFRHFSELPELSQLRTLIANLSLAGRFERHRLGDLELILDVAHNPDASRLLAGRLEGTYKAVFAAMADKDLPEIIAPLAESVSQWWCCQLPDNPRAASAENLAQTVASLGFDAKALDSVAEALAELLEQHNAELGDINGNGNTKTNTKTDKILVLGSFFTVAAARDWILAQPQGLREKSCG